MPQRKKKYCEGEYFQTFLRAHTKNGLLRIAHLFVEENLTLSEIADALGYKDVKTHHIHQYLLPGIIEMGWLSLKTVEDSDLAKRIRESGYQLHEEGSVRVTPAALTDDVATHAADMVSGLVWEIAKRKAEIHIGFSGGNTMRRVFQKLVKLVNTPEWSLPSGATVTCHALVAGFDNKAPGTEPSAFFTYLDDSTPTFKAEFVQFHAPAFVPSIHYDTLMDLPAIAEAKRDAESLDLIVTSAASYLDEHSQLRRYYEAHQNSEQKPTTAKDLKRLQERNCIGDMLWQPFSPTGPVDIEDFDHRPVTVLKLKELPKRIKRETKVVLVIGPCAAEPNDPCKKDGILKAILEQQRVKPDESDSDRKYITHLVVDRHTAQQLYPPDPPKPSDHTAAGSSTSEIATAATSAG